MRKPNRSDGTVWIALHSECAALPSISDVIVPEPSRWPMTRARYTFSTCLASKAIRMLFIVVEVLPQTTSPDVGMSSRWQWCGPSERASACVDGWREDARALTNVRLPLVVLKVGRPAGFSTTAMKSSSYSTSRYSGFPLKSIGDLGIVKKIEEFEAFVPGRDPLFE